MFFVQEIVKTFNEEHIFNKKKKTNFVDKIFKNENPGELKNNFNKINSDQKLKNKKL